MKANDLDRLPDSELLAGLTQFNDKTTAAPADYGLTPAKTAAMLTLLGTYETAISDCDTAENEYDSKLAARRDARRNVVAVARSQFKEVRSEPGITDAELEAAGLDLYDTTQTPSPAPTTAPIGWVDYGKLKHTIYFRDSATPDSEAKPEGMLGCEIWRHIGADVPASEDDYQFVTLDTGSPYVAFYTLADAGKKVLYLLRWVSKSGEKGEWSESIEATINA